jgi:hypothetical protein
MGERLLSLNVGRARPGDRRAQRRRPLTQDQSDPPAAALTRVVPPSSPVDMPHQHLHGHALQHAAAAGSLDDWSGSFTSRSASTSRTSPRRRSALRIDPIAEPSAGHGADRLNDARALNPRDE